MYDFHSHLGATSSGEQKSSAMLVKELSAFGIERVGVSSLSGTVTRRQNDAVYAAMKKHPDFVIGYAFINPKAPDVEDEIDRCLGDMKMKGIKLHPWKHGYYSDNTPQLERVFCGAERYGQHIQAHVGTSPLCTPFAFVEYAKKHKKTELVFTHAACREFGYTAIEMIKDIPNISVETSSQMERELLLKMVRELDSHRILFGTDWPYKPTNVEIDKLFMLGLSDAELENVFYKNAERLWGLR